MKRLTAVLFLAFIAGCSPVRASNDGIGQECFDSVVRIRTSLGRRSYSTGTGNVIARVGDNYVVETNRHVAMDRGNWSAVDVWANGSMVASVPAMTSQSWFRQGESVDIATILVPVKSLPNARIVPLAPVGEKLKRGDTVYTIGCSDGRHPRARCGHVIAVNGGRVRYSPEAIPGDSGGPIYKYSTKRNRWEVVGRNAWESEGDGLGMTSDWIHQIKNQTAYQDFLPEGATKIQLLRRKRIDTPRSTPIRDRIAETRPLRKVFRFFLWVTLGAGLLILWIGPTLISKLTLGWPVSATQSIWGRLRGASAGMLLVCLLAGTASAQDVKLFNLGDLPKRNQPAIENYQIKPNCPNGVCPLPSPKIRKPQTPCPGGVCPTPQPRFRPRFRLFRWRR